MLHCVVQINRLVHDRDVMGLTLCLVDRGGT